jgi:hypothetical protein
MILSISIAFLALVVGAVSGAYVFTVHLRAIYRERIEGETVELRADVKKLRADLAAAQDKMQQVNDSTVLALEDLRGYVSQRYHRALAAESRVKKKEQEEEEEARYQAELKAALGYTDEDDLESPPTKNGRAPLIRRA